MLLTKNKEPEKMGILIKLLFSYRDLLWLTLYENHLETQQLRLNVTLRTYNCVQL